MGTPILKLAETGPLRYRTIWISDVHLGTRGCQAKLLLDFLKHTESEHLFLVGDIVDGWRLERSWYWPSAHNDVVQAVMQKAKQSTKVTYIPGNHDETFRAHVGRQFGQITIAENAVHELLDGRRFLILHGDEFDLVANYARWLAILGDYAYRSAITMNLWFNYGRRKLGFPYWSLSAYLKHKVKNAVGFIGDFEKAVADEARRHGVQGVVCGHIHHPEIRDFGGITYCNDGDWVESCSALVEHEDGRLELIRWRKLGANPAVLKAA
jgi:UDP-2,3-diacylglucosamine pyrophosphatase LpxH